MRVGLQSWGTEGDLRPFLALGAELARRGHTVELVFTGVEGKDFTALAEAAGVSTRFVDDGYFVAHRDMLAQRARASLQLGSPREQFEQILLDLMDPLAASMLAAARTLARDSDVVVGHFLAHTAAAAAAEHGKPYVLLALQPVFASRHYPPAGAPPLWCPFNPLLWKLAEHVMDAALRPRVNDSRRRCGLAPIRRFLPRTLGDARAVLVAVSPSLFPRPSDWDARLEVCGSLDLAEMTSGWTPDDHVARFLDAGEPVYLSFGSMFGLDARQTSESVAVFADALRLADARGLVQAPASAIASAPRDARICYLERAPHAQLFPRCAAIVHHGGAGTTQSALLAGRASVIVPHAADQFYWADMLYARGVAARPLRRSRLAAKPLAERIRAVLDDASMRARAGALSAALRTERGAKRAAELIERAGAQGVRA